MKQVLWFRRDLRITDNAILENASGEVLPIFIFDPQILSNLAVNDKRVTFIFQSVMKLKKELQRIGLDLMVFYDQPVNVFEKLCNQFDEVLCSCDYDKYTIARDKKVEKLIKIRRFYDSFILEPNENLKKDGTPYKVFSSFYNALEYIWSANSLQEFKRNHSLVLASYNFDDCVVCIHALGFEQQTLPEFLECSSSQLLERFSLKIKDYQKDRDYFFKDATSNLSVHLRFGLISPRQVFNSIRSLQHSEFFIRELFWREFYAYLLHHFPWSQEKNFISKDIAFDEDQEKFAAWCEGKTGVPIIDAAMKQLNETGMMHNRLRMIVASYFTKNLFLPWQWGEQYFASKLLDYEVSSNVGSWQWAASTGVDSVPYFRVFNPYTQSEKYDKDGIFIKSALEQLSDVDSKLLHRENGLQESVLYSYPRAIVDIKKSRQQAIERFKHAKA